MCDVAAALLNGFSSMPRGCDSESCLGFSGEVAAGPGLAFEALKRQFALEINRCWAQLDSLRFIVTCRWG